MSQRMFVLFFSLTFVILGMFGLYLQVEYSGWVLAVGVLAALFSDEKEECECSDSMKAVIWLEGYTDRAEGRDDNPYSVRKQK